MASEVYRREQNLCNQISLLKGGFLLLLLGACWGLMPSLSRIIMVDGLHPLCVASWTLGISAVLMLMVSVATGRYPGTTWHLMRRYLVLGLFGNVLSQLLLFWAASEPPAMIIAIILTAKSFIVFIIAASMGLEAPNLKRFIGLSLGLACVVLIMVPGSGSTGSASWVWILIALGVPFCYALEDMIATSTGATIAAALSLAPVTLFSSAFISPDGAISSYGWAFVLIAAISAFSTILLVRTIRTTGAVFASQAGYSMTAAGILWSVVLLMKR